MREIRRPPKLLVLIKIYVKDFDKIVSQIVFVLFADIFIIIFTFDSFFALKAPRNCYCKWEWHCLNLIMSFGVDI